MIDVVFTVSRFHLNNTYLVNVINDLKRYCYFFPVKKKLNLPLNLITGMGLQCKFHVAVKLEVGKNIKRCLMVDMHLVYENAFL